MIDDDYFRHLPVEQLKRLVKEKVDELTGMPDKARLAHLTNDIENIAKVLDEKESRNHQGPILDLQNDIIDWLEKREICPDCATITLWSALSSLYENQLIEEPQNRETIISNIEKQKELLLLNILGPK